MKNKKNNFNEKYNVKTGFFEDGLPYARIGTKPNIIVNIEALSFKNEPPSGIMLKQFLKSSRSFLEEYTVYQIGRKQNVPEDYSFEDMANDYVKLIRREFKEPVVIMGVSTGGQIAHYVAANHPEIVRKLIIISAAYRLSERGVEIERKAGDYFEKGKYGKSYASLLDMVFSSRIIRGMAKLSIILFGRWITGEIKYPNDFLTEIREDREMNFKDRLKDIKVSTLVLSGELDIGYSADDVRMTAEGIPDAKLILYENYGHNLIFHWNEFQNDIIEFLKK
ncbi:MAG: alpha/beta fold hydrolase [Promethearchaeota archaeon]